MSNKIKKVGVSGAIGSFSEQTAIEYFRNKKSLDIEIDYCITADRTLKNVVLGKNDYAVFPIENSNGGIVYESVYAMSKYNFHIKDFFELDVRHCLLVRDSKTKKSQIKKIISHPQAIKQCRMYLKRIWPRVDIIEYADTAKAALDLSRGKLNARDVAVIAPEHCCDLYDLHLLEKSIQDLKFNFTTFIIARK